jgi:hypothetical protein
MTQKETQMKVLVALLVLAAAPSLVPAEEAWRWEDGNGTLHYSNRAEVAPPDATLVKTRLIVETDRLPGAPELATEDGMVTDAVERRAETPRTRKGPRRIYTEKRLRFGCYASNLLYAGGWSHPDDIAAVGNCLPYLLGPEAWLNAARAELGLRQNGIDWREVVHMYVAEGQAEQARRVIAVGDRGL